MIFLIIFNAILIVFDKPFTNKDATITRVIYWIDLSITIIYCIEVILKVFVNGFSYSSLLIYFKDGLNVIDFTTTIISLIGIFFHLEFRIFKALRAIKVLKILNYRY